MQKIWFLEKTLDERWAWETVFTQQECDDIINTYVNSTTAAKIGDGTLDLSVRKSDVCWLTEEKSDWIYERCTRHISNVNTQYFNYDLSYIETLQFSVYKSDNGYYGKHIDSFYRGTGHRKLSFSILLSDKQSYDGGELLMYNDSSPTAVLQERGVMVAFPSYTLHEVCPVTRGTRYTLVGWCNGPKFR